MADADPFDPWTPAAPAGPISPEGLPITVIPWNQPGPITPANARQASADYLNAQADALQATPGGWNSSLRGEVPYTGLTPDDLRNQAAAAVSPAWNVFRPNTPFGVQTGPPGPGPASHWLPVPYGNPGEFMDRETGDLWFVGTSGTPVWQGNLLTTGNTSELQRRESARVAQAVDAGLLPAWSPVPLQPGHSWMPMGTSVAGQRLPTLADFNPYNPSDEAVATGLASDALTGWYPRNDAERGRLFGGRTGAGMGAIIGGLAGTALIPIPGVGTIIGAGLGAAAGSAAGQEAGGGSINASDVGRSGVIGAAGAGVGAAAGSAAGAAGAGAAGSQVASNLGSAAGTAGANAGLSALGWQASTLPASRGGYILNPYLALDRPASEGFGLGTLRDFMASHPLV